MELCLCLFNYFPIGGLQRDFLRLAQAALKKGMRVTCYTMCWEGEVPDGLQVILLAAQGRSNHARCWHFAQLFREALLNKKYDCVVGFNRLPGLDFYFAADLCFQAIARKKHSFLYRLLPRYKKFIELEKSVFAKNSHTQILLLNPQQEKVFQQFYQTPADRFHLISPGIEAPAVIREQASAREEVQGALTKGYKLSAGYWLLMVAKNLKIKGIDRVLKAVAQLPPSLKSKTYFLVIGSDGIEYYKKMAKQLGIANQVLFLGAQKDINIFMQAADILVHPACYEAAGMVLIEALMNRLPVITTDNCGYAFHIQDAKAGIVVPGDPFHISTFEQALIELLTQIPNQALRENAKNYVEHTPLSGMTEQILNLIQKP